MSAIIYIFAVFLTFKCFSSFMLGFEENFICFCCYLWCHLWSAVLFLWCAVNLCFSAVIYVQLLFMGFCCYLWFWCHLCSAVLFLWLCCYFYAFAIICGFVVIFYAFSIICGFAVIYVFLVWFFCYFMIFLCFNFEWNFIGLRCYWKLEI